MRVRPLLRPVVFQGVGLHSGGQTTLRLRPPTAAERTAVVARTGCAAWGALFMRTDLPGAPLLTVADVDEDAPPLCTTLKRGTAKVHTLEHLAAALYGLRVGTTVAELDGPEPPGLDGSALPFAEALAAALGPEEDVPPGEGRTTVPEAPARAAEGEAEIEARPAAEGLTLDYTLYYPDEPAAQGRLAVEITPESFLRELAPARTFCLRREVEPLRAAGFGKGAGPENTVVLENGRSVTVPLRFPDEPVRHKILDLLGDLFLLGRPLRARVVARRSGHRLNRALVRALLKKHG